jgi:dUTP pyrophosphatase
MSRQLKIARLNEKATVPVYGTKEAAGMDISACVAGTIKPNEQVCIPTGLAFQIPKNHVGFLKERSGLSFKNSLALGAGVIDSDYRGEVRAILRNHSDRVFEYKEGDRIAQMVILQAPQWDLLEVSKDQLNSTERGDGGFGSTGVQVISDETRKRNREETTNPAEAEERANKAFKALEVVEKLIELKFVPSDILDQ